MSGPEAARVPLGALAAMFLRLGATAFGGPAAHMAMMQEEIVRRRRWLTNDEFLDFIGAVNLIPGPNSTELAIHVGHARGGWAGLVVAGTSFILPAAIITGAAGWAYVRYGTLPQVAGVMYGLKPVVIAIVAQALWILGRTASKRAVLVGIGLAAAVAFAAGLHELLVLALAGIAGGLLRRPDTRVRGAAAALAGTLAGSSAAISAAAVTAPASFGLWPLFLVFAKVGSVLFGSGYVLLAFLRADFVERLGWLSEQQLLDAIAVGQITPGPLFTTATFIGYLLGGTAGAVVATAGIFAPAFLFVAISGPLIPRVRRSPVARGVLDGVNAASLALMGVVLVQLARAAIVDPVSAMIFAASVVLLVRGRIASVWLMLGGGTLGWLLN
jgi:chromate transporter